MHVPAHEDIHRDGQQIENGAHACNLRQQVAGRGIKSGPRAKLFFQKGVGRYGAAVTVERHEIFGGKVGGNGYGQ